MSDRVMPRSVKAHILRDPEVGECPARIHDIAENDNRERSSFL